MLALVAFFIVLTGGLFAFAWAMGPIADGWALRERRARDECEAIRRRLIARGIEPDG